jgi:hypothetical protein
MRPDLVTTQGLSLLPKSLLEFSSDTLPPQGGEDSEGNDFGFSQSFALPLNGRAVGIGSNILEHETQKAYNLRVAPRDQNMRARVPLSGEGEPISLIELGHEL